MKASRRRELARRRAEATLDRLEALERSGHLTAPGFLAATPPIRAYLAALEDARGQGADGSRSNLEARWRVLERTRALAVAVGLGGVWDETMHEPSG